jgi:hypothetical protein
MKQIDKVYKAQKQGKTGYTLTASDEVFAYLGVGESNPTYHGFIDGKDFVLSAVNQGPGLKFSDYTVRSIDKWKGSRVITLPKIWGDHAGITHSSSIIKYEDEFKPDNHTRIPVVRIRSLVDALTMESEGVQRA